MSHNRTLANQVLPSSLVAVATSAKARSRALSITLSTGSSLEVRISHIGSNYVAGEIAGRDGVIAIIPAWSIVSVEVESIIELTDTAVADRATESATRSHLAALLANSQRLSHSVAIHTTASNFRGLISSVAGDAVVLDSPFMASRLFVLSHIVWIGVDGD